MSAERVVYVDSSAIVKLVVREPESAALATYLRRKTGVSSALARVEVERACRIASREAGERAIEVLRRFDLLRLSERVLSAAGSLEPSELRSLDAIHLATAAQLGASLTAVVTYDVRMAEAARAQGIRVVAPGAS
jgi:predicted nucleic acid-binding protein